MTSIANPPEPEYKSRFPGPSDQAEDSDSSVHSDQRQDDSSSDESAHPFTGGKLPAKPSNGHAATPTASKKKSQSHRDRSEDSKLPEAITVQPEDIFLVDHDMLGCPMDENGLRISIRAVYIDVDNHGKRIWLTVQDLMSYLKIKKNSKLIQSDSPGTMNAKFDNASCRKITLLSEIKKLSTKLAATTGANKDRVAIIAELEEDESILHGRSDDDIPKKKPPQRKSADDSTNPAPKKRAKSEKSAKRKPKLPEIVESSEDSESEFSTSMSEESDDDDEEPPKGKSSHHRHDRSRKHDHSRKHRHSHGHSSKKHSDERKKSRSSASHASTVPSSTSSSLPKNTLKVEEYMDPGRARQLFDSLGANWTSVGKQKKETIVVEVLGAMKTVYN